jgi:hypothetical protein
MIGCTQRKPCCQTMSTCLREFVPVYGLVLLCSRSRIRCSVVMTFHWSQTTPQSQTQSLGASYHQLTRPGKKIHSSHQSRPLLHVCLYAWTLWSQMVLNVLLLIF